MTDFTNEWLARKDNVRMSCGDSIVREHMVMNDGFRMSVQASKYHYCTPQKTNAESYDTVEIAFSNRREELLEPYGDYSDVFGYVPVEVANEIIEKHGGLKKEDD